MIERKSLKTRKLLTLVTAILIGLMASDGSAVAGQNGKGKGKVAKGKHHKKPKKGHVKTPPLTVTTYSGQATLVYLTNGLADPTTIYLGDTGPLPSAGGAIEINLGATNVSSLQLGSGRAYTTGASNVALSQVSLENFSFTFYTTNNDAHVVTFSALTADAGASCLPDGTVQLASQLTIQNLTLDGQAITVTGETNQTIGFTNGALILNFQQSSSAGNFGEIMIAGLVIALEGGMHGGIGIVHADIRCGGAPCDRITGGGFILGTPSGHRGSLSVKGGIRRGTPVGHLKYIDHDSGMHVISTELVSYSAVDAEVREIVYNVMIDGAPGTATVLVADRGEPGRNDLFDLTLSNGYHAGGDLGGDGPGGGNIQLHRCPPGWLK